jgi:hypothetical protein
VRQLGGWNQLERPAFDEYGTGLTEANDSGTRIKRRRPAFFEPDWNDRCRNADAGVSFLDADAHLCLKNWSLICGWKTNILGLNLFATYTNLFRGDLKNSESMQVQIEK